jgi:anaerobic ribonucleoside-triphosphate reductase
MMQCRLKPDHNGLVGVGVRFERIRRVTGYLVGTLDRFNDAKRAEERDRVKHLHV